MYKYKYNEDFAEHAGLSEDELEDTGVLAQEVREVLPDAVCDTGDIILPNGQRIENFLVVNKVTIYLALFLSHMFNFVSWTGFGYSHFVAVIPGKFLKLRELLIQPRERPDTCRLLSSMKNKRPFFKFTFFHSFSFSTIDFGTSLSLTLGPHLYGKCWRSQGTV